MELNLNERDRAAASWIVLSDISITMVLVVVLLLTLLFLATFRDRFVNDRLAQRQEEVSEKIRSQIDNARVEIRAISPDRQRLTFSADVLFAECEAELRSEGRELLHLVGQLLSPNQTYFEAVEIEGHTDTVPVGPKCDFPSNWELSSARATAVVSLFATEGVIGEKKLSAIGRSKFHPVSDDNSRNRRIEMILQYDRAAILDGMGGERNGNQGGELADGSVARRGFD